MTSTSLPFLRDHDEDATPQALDWMAFRIVTRMSPGVCAPLMTKWFWGTSGNVPTSARSKGPSEEALATRVVLKRKKPPGGLAKRAPAAVPPGGLSGTK